MRLGAVFCGCGFLRLRFFAVAVFAVFIAVAVCNGAVSVLNLNSSKYLSYFVFIDMVMFQKTA